MADPVRIPLGHGQFALVDDEDYFRVGFVKWHLKRKSSQPGKLYAQRTVVVDGKKTAVVMHREIMQATDGELIDHRNGNGLDNRRENLRRTDARGNATNVTRSRNQKRGGFKGVSWNANAGKWEAGIGAGPVKANGRRARVYLGLFDDPTDAARAYDAAALMHFGEFATLNFPENDSKEAAS